MSVHAIAQERSRRHRMCKTIVRRQVRFKGMLKARKARLLEIHLPQFWASEMRDEFRDVRRGTARGVSTENIPSEFLYTEEYE